jgi:hypothetical protein
MTKRHLIILAGLLATVSFGTPTFASQSPATSYTDGYTLADRDREASFPVRDLVPATPRQQAQIALSERSRTVTDGFSGDDWDQQQSAELQNMMAKMVNEPKIEALIMFYETQRRSLDGKG